MTPHQHRHQHSDVDIHLSETAWHTFWTAILDLIALLFGQRRHTLHHITAEFGEVSHCYRSLSPTRKEVNTHA